MPAVQDIATRFWSKVDKTTSPQGCWVWTAARANHPHGKGKTYGQFWIGRKADGTGHMVPAHKVAWEMTNGKVPDGLKVLHRCDNCACVRPKHLFLGTQKDNVADMMAKGRGKQPFGARHNKAKLTDENAKEIMRRYVPGKRGLGHGNCKMLAAEFGVSMPTITDVIRRTWNHLKKDQ